MHHNLIKVWFVALFGAIRAQRRAKALILSISGPILGSILDATSIKKSFVFWYHCLIDFLMVSGWILALF